MAVSIVSKRRRVLVEAILSMQDSVQDDLCDFRTGIVVTDGGPGFGTATACQAAGIVAGLDFDIHDVHASVDVRNQIALAVAPKDATLEALARCGYLFSLGSSEGSILVIAVSNPAIDLRSVSDEIKKIDRDALVSVWPRTDLGR